MATGRHLQLTKQTGEYLVAAELCRRGFIATTFTGNVPIYDIVASDANGNHVLIQVKTSRSANWQLDIQDCAQVEYDGKKQELTKPLPIPISNLICIFLKLNEPGKDQFFIFPSNELQSILIPDYEEYLALYKGVRPRNPKSFHTTIQAKQIAKYENNWSLVEKTLMSC